MGERTRIYAIPLNACGFDTAKVCWGSCGKGSIGGIDLGYDAAIPCGVPAAQCPHFISESKKPIGTVPKGRGTGELPLYLRKLKPEAHKIRQPLAFYVQAVKRWLRWELKRLPVRAWRWAFPLPPECETCGRPLRDHKPLPAVDADTLLDREHFYGARLRVSMAGSVVLSVDVFSCDGSRQDGIALLESDAESLRDALYEALRRMPGPPTEEQRSESP